MMKYIFKRFLIYTVIIGGIFLWVILSDMNLNGKRVPESNESSQGQVGNEQPISSIMICTKEIELPDCLRDTGQIIMNWELSASGTNPEIFKIFLEISDSEVFTDIVYENDDINSRADNFVIPVKVLLPEKKYFWRLKTVDEHGRESDWAVCDKPFISPKECL